MLLVLATFSQTPTLEATQNLKLRDRQINKIATNLDSDDSLSDLSVPTSKAVHDLIRRRGTSELANTSISTLRSSPGLSRSKTYFVTEPSQAGFSDMWVRWPTGRRMMA